MENCQIRYGERTITFRVRFANRRTLEISVLPNGAVEVVAPHGTAKEKVIATVRRRARWIVHQQRYFNQFVPRTPPRRYVSGETHRYLGRQYRLKVVASDAPHVKLLRGRLFIETPEPKDAGRNAELLADWYIDRARIKFPDRLREFFSPFARLGFDLPPLDIRPLRRRWGSLSPKGRLTLNRDLIRAPIPCIDYVITHELCHLKHPDHSPAFWQLLDQVMPDWEKRKRRLERVMI